MYRDKVLAWLAAVAFGVLALSANVAEARTTVFRSPRAGWSVDVVYKPSGVTAELHAGQRVVSIFTDLPFPGAVGVTWLGDDTAELAAGCGSGCSAVFFASAQGTSGPFPSVLSADAKSLTFAYVNDGVVALSTIGPPAEVVRTFPVPEWCPDLDCDLHQSYAGGRYVFSAGGHKISVPLPASNGN